MGKSGEVSEMKSKNLSDTFKPYGSDSSFGKECYGRHTIVKAKDYIFTSYPRR
jgi:hypothetical protein